MSLAFLGVTLLEKLLQIRKAQLKDMERIASIYYESRLASESFLPKEQLQITDLKRDIVDEEVYVCFFQQQIIGFLSYYRPDSFIHLLFIDPAFFRKGAGKALINYAINHFTKPLTLKCLANNTSALAFYQRLGFVCIEKVEGKTIHDDYYTMQYQSVL